MMDIQSRNPVLGDHWRTGSSKPAGLYGELPPLPAHLPPETSVAARSVRKRTPAD
jgi:hypothetical protein